MTSIIQSTATIILLAIVAVTTTTAQGYWQQTGGPQDGDILALATDSAGTIYAPNQGGFVSTDDGKHWARPDTSTESRLSGAVAADFQGNVYTINTSSRSGVWRSTDRGATWFPIHRMTVYSNQPEAIAVKSGGLIFASATGAFERYGLNDTSWADIRIFKDKPSDKADTVRALAILPGGEILAGTSAGVYRSNDNGTSWSAAMNGIGLRRIVAIATTPAGDIFAAGDSLLFRSTDGGGSWTALSPTLDGVACITTLGSATVFVGTNSGSCFSSSDGGDHWKQTTVPGMFPHSILSTRNGSLLVGSSINGMFRSTDDGTTWSGSSTGMNSSSVYTVAVAPSGRIYAGGWGEFSGFIYNSSDGGRSWQGIRPTPAPQEIVSCLVALPNNHVLAGSGGTGIYRTTDDGTTWTQQNSGLGNLAVRSFAMKPNGELLAGTERGLFISSDEGTTWRPTGLTAPEIWSLAIHPDGTLLAGGNKGPIYYSTDDGTTWSSVTPTGAISDIQSLLVASDKSVYAVSFHNGVDRSTDVGRSWTQLTNPHTGTTTVLYSILEGRDGNIYLGGFDEGFFKTTDTGNSWTILGSGQPKDAINAIAMDSSGYLLLGSDGHGVLRSTASTGAPSSVEATRSPEDNTEPLASYPNPTNGLTLLSFRIGHACRVRLCLYDLLGNQVATIADMEMGPGSYSLPWNTQGLPAGTYRCALRTAQETQTTTLVVCR